MGEGGTGEVNSPLLIWGYRATENPTPHWGGGGGGGSGGELNILLSWGVQEK